MPAGREELCSIWRKSIRPSRKMTRSQIVRWLIGVNVGYSFIVLQLSAMAESHWLGAGGERSGLQMAPDRQKKVITSHSLVSAFVSKSREGERLLDSDCSAVVYTQTERRTTLGLEHSQQLAILKFEVVEAQGAIKLILLAPRSCLSGLGVWYARRLESC
jgi:hypothetical protein